MSKLHRGAGGPNIVNHTSEGDETFRSSTEWPITGEHEIDIGLRRRPPESFFIRGPIPLSEFLPALKLGRGAVGVYALILHRAAYSKQDWVTLPTYALKEWGLTVDIRADALKRLEQAGIITVSRPQGGYLKVRLNRKSKKGRRGAVDGKT